ncbi:putative membrane-anchored protein [Magnetofaba australis IT-1]|uniref:Putative membrane-anchored protein n=1 Tax=Magnetofaba australis IT-1 TaxID=1434232 RepID=A0A1Y2K6E0_9PROT|nr:putative membrane-anchored protein [Magnetofaba australis IT-1]
MLHLGFYTGESGADEDRIGLDRLCRFFGIQGPAPDTNHFIGQLNPTLRIKWERHTEFVSYTFYLDEPFDEPFDGQLIERLPLDWTDECPGRLLSAVQIAIDPKDAPERDMAELNQIFKGNPIFGNLTPSQTSKIYSDMRIHPDRFVRILIKDVDMSKWRAGRLVQRLSEITSYRMMALLGLPVARAAIPQLRQMDLGLAAIAAEMKDSKDPNSDAEIQRRLTELSAQIESITTSTTYRLGASRAYYAILLQRLSSLGTQRIAGLQTLADLIERRMEPAMATCESTLSRQHDLSERAARVAGLMRSRVEVFQAEQNRQLLASMDHRAKLQLHLQETVEGLSVMVVSYYAISLCGYVFKSIKNLGAPINLDLATGIAVPVVLVTVWMGMRRMRKRFAKLSGDAH